MKESADTEHKRRGSLMVEACIMMPLFLFLIMAMAGAFRFLRLEESLFYSGFEEMQRCSVRMSLDYPSARIGRLYLEHGIMTRTMEDMGEEQKGWIHLTGLREEGMFFSQEQWDPQGEIRCRICCTLSVGNDTGFFSDEVRFLGRSCGGEDQRSVWIFPHWGECYHVETCYVTGGQRLRTVEDVAKKQGYRPCQICMKGYQTIDEM